MKRWHGRLLDWLLTTDRRQRIRLSLTLLAGLLMLGAVAIMHMLVGAGIADGRVLLPWTVLSLTGPCICFLLIRLGCTRTLHDPAMTMVQMSFIISCDALAYLMAGEAAGATLPGLAIVLMFGLFGLSLPQVRLLAGFAAVVFGLAVSVSIYALPSHLPPSVHLAHLLATLMVLAACTFLTVRQQEIRTRLRVQNDELGVALDQIRVLATRDELTGLANRRNMVEVLQNEIRRIERSRQPLSVALLDIDHFKRINDRFGHLAGDMALRAFARSALECIRTTDVLSRWGGEEFLLLLPNTTPAEARRSLDRLLVRVSGDSLPTTSGPLSMTVSAGLTGHQAGESLEQLVDRADRALYRAKKSGRNRVETD